MRRTRSRALLKGKTDGAIFGMQSRFAANKFSNEKENLMPREAISEMVKAPLPRASSIQPVKRSKRVSQHFSLMS